jgi:antitoxin component YwqK of YwqJK toxin-antitoxin module
MKNILLLICLFPLFTCAQKLPDFGLDKVHIVNDGQNIQAETIPVNSEPELHNNRFYYWYSSNKIHSTQGGYSGRLLNGNYKEFYPDKTLKEEGDFKEGLKDGIWKDWNPHGDLSQQYTWKKGLLSGKFIICDEKGYIKQSGKYHDGVLMVKDSVSFWHKLDFFKKNKAVSPNTKP